MCGRSGGYFYDHQASPTVRLRIGSDDVRIYKLRQVSPRYYETFIDLSFISRSKIILPCNQHMNIKLNFYNSTFPFCLTTYILLTYKSRRYCN